MEGKYNMYSKGSSGWTTMRNEEFQERDVWDVFKGRTELGLTIGTSEESSPNLISRRHPTAARMIPRATSHPAQETKLVQHSAPVKIPDWSKIIGTNSKKPYKNAAWLDHDEDDDDDGGSDGLLRGSWDSEDDDDEDENGNIIPPHEWIAKKLARNQISSFSVCEGVGRTLKGTDLRRVRNAILTKTGFLEQ